MSKEPGLRLTIKQPKLSPHTTRVWLDGMEISHGLQNIAVQWSADGVTMATLTIGIREIDMDAQTIAHLIAMAEAQTAAQQEATTTTTHGEHAP